MKVQNRLFKLKTLVDAVLLFMSSVKLLASLANGHYKKRILTDHHFERTHKNNSESVESATILKKSFSSSMSTAVRRLASRLINIFKRIILKNDNLDLMENLRICSSTLYALQTVSLEGTLIKYTAKTI